MGWQYTYDRYDNVTGICLWGALFAFGHTSYRAPSGVLGLLGEDYSMGVEKLRCSHFHRLNEYDISWVAILMNRTPNSNYTTHRIPFFRSS